MTIENGQVLFPDKSFVGDYSTWQAISESGVACPGLGGD